MFSDMVTGIRCPSIVAFFIASLVACLFAKTALFCDVRVVSSSFIEGSNGGHCSYKLLLAVGNEVPVIEEGPHLELRELLPEEAKQSCDVEVRDDDAKGTSLTDSIRLLDHCAVRPRDANVPFEVGVHSVELAGYALWDASFDH